MSGPASAARDQLIELAAFLQPPERREAVHDPVWSSIWGNVNPTFAA
jgi:hypothetical protein